MDRLLSSRSRAHFILPSTPPRYVSVVLIPPTTSRSISSLNEQEASRLRDGSRLVALDSPCYHASGPLGEGEVVEIEDLATATTAAHSSSFMCIVCPWHQFLISLETGEEVLVYDTPSTSAAAYRVQTVLSGGRHRPTSSRPSGGSTYAASIRMGKRVQRMHRASLDEESGRLSIAVEREGNDRRVLKSDGPACSKKNGGLCIEIQDIKARGLDLL